MKAKLFPILIALWTLSLPIMAQNENPGENEDIAPCKLPLFVAFPH
jgi:hypothetical protein